MNSNTLLLAALTTLITACGPQPGADLDGTWDSPCFNGTQTRIVYASLKLTGTYTEYSDMTCTTPRHVATWTGTSTVPQASSSGPQKLNVTFSSFKSKPLIDADTAMVNMFKYCGLTDWATGVERDILGRECFGFSIPTGGKSFDLYEVKGNTLRFGKDSVITAMPEEAKRPTALSDNTFTRVGK
jgi:hypothetical protein